MIQQAILTLARGENLSPDMAQESMNDIMSGKATPVQMSAYLTALSIKGATIEEITASAQSMRNHCVRLLHNMDALEIVGTGGDGANTFNISTTAAIIAAAAGAHVSKHGNRAATSQCGTADVLEALGVNIQVPAERSAQLLEQIGICFLFAQNYHIAMKYVAPVRRELGLRTIFNILGPLVNPAGANMELMGVYDQELVEPLATVLMNLQVKRAMVVHGHDGLDEISLCAATSVCEVNNGRIFSYRITPEQFGFTRCLKEDLQGGSPAENAAIIRNIFQGEQSPKRDAAILNAAAALYLADIVPDFAEGVTLATRMIDEGLAMQKLDEFIRYSNQQ